MAPPTPLGSLGPAEALGGSADPIGRSTEPPLGDVLSHVGGSADSPTPWVAFVLTLLGFCFCFRGFFCRFFSFFSSSVLLFFSYVIILFFSSSLLLSPLVALRIIRLLFFMLF